MQTRILIIVDNLDTVYDASEKEIARSVKVGIGKSLEENLTDSLDGKNPNNHVYIGETPNSLCSILGIPKLPMLMTNKHVYTNIKTKDNPIAIIKSSKDQNDLRVFVVTDNVDNDGNVVVSVLKPCGTGRISGVVVNSNVNLSNYGKEGLNNAIESAIEEDRVLYVNKKRQFEKVTTGSQLTNGIFSTAFSENLSRYKDSVKYISEKESVPLIAYDSDGRYLSLHQQKYFSKSKVVDDNGRLKVMYHGTPHGGFNVFRPNSYFTENEWYAKAYTNARRIRRLFS
ncbi:MAG: hypothetical protein Q4B73_08890 [Lachnospiraceae bacterium]|nr:hypothetical protein [Lachnospiraceae bacterium]